MILKKCFPGKSLISPKSAKLARELFRGKVMIFLEDEFVRIFEIHLRRFLMREVSFWRFRLIIWLWHFCSLLTNQKERKMNFMGSRNIILHKNSFSFQKHRMWQNKQMVRKLSTQVLSSSGLILDRKHFYSFTCNLKAPKMNLKSFKISKNVRK